MTDEINSPSHYMLFPDMEAIDVIKAALTPEEFAGYCKGNALKYRLRAGEKGPVEKCIAKACWYQNKLREVTRADFGQQNTIDCRTDEQKGFNDPRTVEGVDVSFETEKHMNFAPEQCEHDFSITALAGSMEKPTYFGVCSKCGIKEAASE